jgi:hypothetical protein
LCGITAALDNIPLVIRSKFPLDQLTPRRSAA